MWQVPVYLEILWMLTELGVVRVLVLLGARLASLSVMLSTEYTPSQHLQLSSSKHMNTESKIPRENKMTTKI